MYHRNPLGLDVEFEERKKKPPSDLRTNNKRPNVIRNAIPIFPSRYVSRRIGVKRRRRRKIPPYVTNSDNENGTKRNKMKRNETISTTASRILYRRQPCNDQGERTYILMYRYWCPAIDNSTRINHYFFFFFSVRKSSKSSGLSIARGDECIVSIRRLKAAATVALPTACPTNYS